MIKKIIPTADDKKAFNRCERSSTKTSLTEEDYSQVVVRKPWGYEYQIFRNKYLSIWALSINFNHHTSMHCHKMKKTSITILSGKVQISLIGGKHRVSTGEAFVLDPKVFHSTLALSRKGVLVLEIESPVCKKDLYRLFDSYGREKKGYEGSNFIEPRAGKFSGFQDGGSEYINKTIRLGDCVLKIKKTKNIYQLVQELKVVKDDTLLTILKGKIYNRSRKLIFSPGDSFNLKQVNMTKDLKISKEVELLFIDKHE